VGKKRWICRNTFTEENLLWCAFKYRKSWFQNTRDSKQTASMDHVFTSSS